jgi:hypothetical protein
VKKKMTANELAQKFIAQGLGNEYLSPKQGDWLFALAKKEGKTNERTQRTAYGDGWKLVRDQGRWLLMVTS